MRTIQITTVTANFIKMGSELTVEDAIQAFKAMPEDIPVHIAYCDDATGQYAEYGTKGIVPSIWTHTPVPVGFPIVAVQTEFEATACNVLGDYDNTPNFDKCGQYDDTRTNSYNDNRYVSESVRAAWMMYLELAIKHFNESN